MTIAFVLSGGASLGAVQVGMLTAMETAGIRPDLVIGTSVGAINAAWIAAETDWRLDRLQNVWTSMRRSQVFPSRPHGLFGLLGRRAGLVDHGPLQRLIRQQLPYERLEDAAVPVHVIVTDVLTGRDVRLSSGPAVEAVLASAAIPGVFAPVVIDGRAYMDGGVVNNAAISHAVELGATTIYVLPTGFACALDQPPTNAISMALHGLSVLVQHRLADDVEHFRDTVELHVVPPPCPITVGPADFSHAKELIHAASETTASWLELGRHADLRTLRSHDHPH